MSSDETEEEKRNQNRTSDVGTTDNKADVNGVNENKEPNSQIQYRKKITPDGRIVRVLLSDGETSSGIESVSSADGVDDVASDDMNAFMKNVFVEVKNEFALQHSEGGNLKTPKKGNSHQQDFNNGSKENDGKMDAVNSPSYDSRQEYYHEKTYESRNSSEWQHLNYKGSKRDEIRGSSNRSDERIPRRSWRTRESRTSTSSRRDSSQRKNSRDRSRSRSVSRNRRRLSSQERRRSKNSRRRCSRSLSRGRSPSTSRRRSRSVSRRPTSLGRKRSRSLSKTRTLFRRRSRSLSQRRSRSPIKSRSVRRRSSSRKRSNSPERVSSTSYEKRETGIGNRESSVSYCSVTESRRGRGIRNFGFQSTTIQVTDFFPPVFGPRYYWGGINRFPRGFVRGPLIYPSIKRPHTTVNDEDTAPAVKIPKKPDEFNESVSPDNSSKDNPSRSVSTETKQDQNEISSEATSRLSPDEGKVFTDTEDRPLPKLPDSTGCSSSEVSEYRGPLPTISLDNLPLVPGPKGLPVHVTQAGVTIYYDMDGRRIPIGPNGHYLPLDASGRLFPHVITVDNNAVPIYISEDGVLRLPDSRPVPFGSPHKLPVNIDGKMILMGPDSRPLVPCPNLPVRPPVHLSQVKNLLSPCTMTPKTEVKSPQSESNQVVDSSGIEVVDLDMTIDLDEDRNINSKPNEHNSSGDSQTKPIELTSTTDPLFDICTGPDIQKILDSIDENLLKKVQELAQQQKRIKKKKRASREDPVVVQIRAVIKSLTESNYQPPQYGRFILPEVMFKPPQSDIDIKLQSPLLRNRIMLPFITPEPEDAIPETPESPSESSIPYTFVSTGNFNVFGDSTPDEAEVNGIEDSLEMDKWRNKRKMAEFGVQCDFTTDIISEFNLTVSKLRKEIISLQNAYSTLLEMYERASVSKDRSLQDME